MEKEKNKIKNVIIEEEKFSKENLLQAKKFKNQKDLANVLVKDDETLSFTELQERIDKFMKGKVK